VGAQESDGNALMLEQVKRPSPWRKKKKDAAAADDDMRPSATRPLAHLRSSASPALMMFEVMECFLLEQAAHHATRAHIGLCALSHY
jgi:hypothetical protein